MNNKIFIPARDYSEIAVDALRKNVEDGGVFDRHGDVRLVDKYGKFGFASVVPGKRDSKLRCFFRLLGCSYVYLPCRWQEDKCGRMAFTVAELFNKKVIFESDGVCR